MKTMSPCRTCACARMCAHRRVSTSASPNENCFVRPFSHDTRNGLNRCWPSCLLSASSRNMCIPNAACLSHTRDLSTALVLDQQGDVLGADARLQDVDDPQVLAPPRAYIVGSLERVLVVARTDGRIQVRTLHGIVEPLLPEV